MKAVHPNINYPLVTEGKLINETVIESEEIFSDIVLDLYGQMEGRTGDLVFSDGGKIMTIKSLYTIAKPSDMDMNSRAFLNKVYKHIEQEVIKDAVPEEYYKALHSLFEVISSLSEGYYLTPDLVEDVPLSQTLSLFQMHYPDVEMTFMEQLMDFIVMQRELFKTKLFVFVQVRAFMTPDDFENLLEFARYEQIQLWFIEFSEKSRPVNEDNYYRLIVDQDGCEI